ncbi:MAG: hypothetical protein RDV41_12920 [Planctomycetota bacterium]|nr:hypothetical protein [Planctomycetota bacterium]
MRKKGAYRVCKDCGRTFVPKSKSNKFCFNAACRANRRKRYMDQYMRKWRDKHPSYWKTAEQREYLRKWREAHPGYFKNWRKANKRRLRAKAGR